MGAKPFKVLWKVVFPTLIPTMFSLTVMTFITGLCAMSAPTLLGYDSINPEIVRLAGSSVADEAFPQARAALLSIIPRDVHDRAADRALRLRAQGPLPLRLQDQSKAPEAEDHKPHREYLAHIYAYVLFIIYMIPVVMIVIFSFQTYGAIRMKKLDFSQWTLINYFGEEDYQYLTTRGTYKVRKGSISGLFANEATLGGIKMSFVLSILAAALACLIVVIACNYIFKNRSKKSGVVLEYCLLFPWLLPTILICYSYRTYFNAENIWYVGNVNLYFARECAAAARAGLHGGQAAVLAAYDQGGVLRHRRGAGGRRAQHGCERPHDLLRRVKLPIILPSVLAVFALNFNALFTEYDMSATFASSYGTSYAMVIQAMCAEEGLYGYNVNASGRRCASTVFIMLVSGVILYLVYGVGARDLGERLEARERRRRRVAKLTGLFKKEPAAVAAEAEEAAVAAAVPDEPGEKL